MSDRREGQTQEQVGKELLRDGDEGLGRASAVTCWLCGDNTTQTCRCHDHAPNKPAAPCNMVCNA